MTRSKPVDNREPPPIVQADATMLRDVWSFLMHPAVLSGLAAFSVVAVVVSVLLVPRYLATLPPDFLVNGHRPEPAPLAFRIARNAFGCVLALLGLLMLVLPGQGLLTLLVGVMLVDFPGKYRLVQRVLARPNVLRVVNRLRALRNSPPLWC